MEYIISGMFLLVFQILGWIGAGGYNFIDGTSFPVLVYNFVGLLGFCAVGILGAVLIFLGVKSRKKSMPPFERKRKKSYTILAYTNLVLVALVFIYNLCNGFSNFSIFLLIQIVGNGALISYAVCYILGRKSYGLEVALLSAGISYIIGIINVLPNYLVYVKDTEYSTTIWLFGYLPQLIAAVCYFVIYAMLRKRAEKSTTTSVANIASFALMTFCVFLSTLCIMGHFQIVVDEWIFPLGLFFFVWAEKSKRYVDEVTTTTSRILFCRKCGNKLLEDSLFCNLCGTPVVEVSDQETK